MVEDGAQMISLIIGLGGYGGLPIGISEVAKLLIVPFTVPAALEAATRK
jgi:hypothetical protein